VLRECDQALHIQVDLRDFVLYRVPKESATQPSAGVVEQKINPYLQLSESLRDLAGGGDVGEIRLDRLDSDAMLGSELDCQLFHRFERPRYEHKVGAPLGESLGIGASKPFGSAGKPTFIRGLKFMLDCVLKGWLSRRPSKAASIVGPHSAVSSSTITSGFAELCNHYVDWNALGFPAEAQLNADKLRDLPERSLAILGNCVSVVYEATSNRLAACRHRLSDAGV
jgi:hypothetical protein